MVDGKGEVHVWGAKHLQGKRTLDGQTCSSYNSFHREPGVGHVQ